MAGEAGGAGGVFRAWQGVITAGLANTIQSEVTVVTVPDAVWSLNIPQQEDPLSKDPVFQRQVVVTQLVPGKIDQQTGVVKTVGGRSLVIKREAGQLTVNEVPVKEVIKAGGNEVSLSPSQPH